MRANAQRLIAGSSLGQSFLAASAYMLAHREYEQSKYSTLVCLRLERCKQMDSADCCISCSKRRREKLQAPHAHDMCLSSLSSVMLSYMLAGFLRYRTGFGMMLGEECKDWQLYYLQLMTGQYCLEQVILLADQSSKVHESVQQGLHAVRLHHVLGGLPPPHLHLACMRQGMSPRSIWLCLFAMSGCALRTALYHECCNIFASAQVGLWW